MPAPEWSSHCQRRREGASVYRPLHSVADSRCYSQRSRYSTLRSIPRESCLDCGFVQMRERCMQRATKKSAKTLGAGAAGNVSTWQTPPEVANYEPPEYRAI